MRVNAIAIEGLTKTFGSKLAVDSIDLTVERGEIVGFLGANGAGKSTTLRCLVGLLHPTCGTIRVLDLDPASSHNELMPRLGYLPGELRLYEELSGRQHLEFLATLGKIDVRDRQAVLCTQFGLSSDDLDRPIGQYSRGMKQKIGIIQAFQHSPDVVFLDEPTEGLDPLVQQAFFQLLTDEQARGCTIFLSSHVMSEVQRICERAAIIRSGKLVAVDTVDALRSARSRRLRITFAPSVEPASVDLEPDWGEPSWKDHELSLTLNPDAVVSVLRKLLERDTIDVVVEEAGLDEAVLDYYGSPQS